MLCDIKTDLTSFILINLVKIRNLVLIYKIWPQKWVGMILKNDKP